jgi:hypothetical protein
VYTWGPKKWWGKFLARGSVSNGKLISILILSIAKHTLTELLHKELDFIIGYYLRDFRQIHYLSSEKNFHWEVG